MEKLQKPRTPKRFYFITLLIFLPVFYCLTVIRALWYGWVIAAIAFAALLWMRKTVLWRRWRVVLCFACAFGVAFAGMAFAKPQRGVSLTGQIAKGTVRLFLQLPLDQNLRSGEAFSEATVWTPPEGYSFRTAQLANSRLELLSKNDSSSPYAVLQLHGGAFVAGLNDMYRMFAVRYCDGLGGALVATLDYRLAPAYPYPAQQDDAMDAWRYLTETLGIPADHIVIAGDSAGGNLTLSTSLRLRDAGSAMPMGLVCMSPWADLSNSGPSHLYNARVDPSFGVSLDDMEYDGTPVGVQTTYPDGLDATDPYLSPSYGDYAGFPPMLLQAGSIEVLLSDSQMVRDNAESHGVDCTLTVYTGMFHVFQGSLDLLPESRAAWAEVMAFLKRLSTP